MIGTETLQEGTEDMYAACTWIRYLDSTDKSWYSMQLYYYEIMLGKRWLGGNGTPRYSVPCLLA